MNQNISNINAQTVDSPVGSYNTVTYSEQHIHQKSGGQNVSIDVLLSQINAIITRPQTCRLDDTLKKSTRGTALAVPDLPAIECIVSKSPPRTVRRRDGHGNDLEATAAGILQIHSLAQRLLEPNIDNELESWQTLVRLFGSLGSRFADMGWFVGAMRMGCHEVQIRCALANSQSHPIPANLSISSITPAMPPHHVEILAAFARLLHHRSLYSANVFCFNDARKASKQAIWIQGELCMHVPANTEFKSALSWMKRHLSSFRRQDAAYNAIVCHSVGNMVPFPADVNKFDIARGTLRQAIEVGSGMVAIFSLIAGGPIVAGAVFATGWGIGESLSFINRRF